MDGAYPGEVAPGSPHAVDEAVGEETLVSGFPSDLTVSAPLFKPKVLTLLVQPRFFPLAGPRPPRLAPRPRGRPRRAGAVLPVLAISRFSI